MKQNKWDTYYKSHYKPEGADWSVSDVVKYKKWYASWIVFIRKHCDALQQKAVIFEIGSGVGSVAHMLYESGHDVTGSDITPMMVKKANEFCKPVRFVSCDAQNKLPVKKGTGVILGFEVLEHIPDVEKAIKNIRAALIPGGYFIGTSPYPYPKNYIDPTHVNVKYPGEWVRLFKKHKFGSVTTIPMSFFPFLWRVHPSVNIVIPFRISLPLFVSTTLIIARTDV